MATVPYSTSNLRDFDAAGMVKIKWLNLKNGDEGTSVASPGLADKSIQVTGTFGSGGKVVIEGSNDDGVTWNTINDPQGSDLDFTLGDIRAILPNVEDIRPRVSAGDGTTNLNVYMVAERPK